MDEMNLVPLQGAAARPPVTTADRCHPGTAYCAGPVTSGDLVLRGLVLL